MGKLSNHYSRFALVNYSNTLKDVSLGNKSKHKRLNIYRDCFIKKLLNVKQITKLTQLEEYAHGLKFAMMTNVN